MRERDVCVLCGCRSEPFFEKGPKRYLRCPQCAAVFLDPVCRISSDEEKKRYALHRNDAGNAGYLEFLAPLVHEVETRRDTRCAVLDFGSGPTPVLADILRAKGYDVALYDPYFSPDRTVLERTYDLIVCCEVIEHFRDPAEEFALLRRLLKPDGALICMTDFVTDTTDFANWYYKNDATHIFFCHERTCAYIERQFGFGGLTRNGRVAVFAA